MKYPMLANWIEIKKNDNHQYMMVNLFDRESIPLDNNLSEFLLKLDGNTDPFTIGSSLSKDELKNILDELEEKGYIRSSRLLCRSKGSFLFTLFIPDKIKNYQKIMSIINYCLIFMWLPLFVYGCCRLNVEVVFDNYSNPILGLVIGYIIGGLFHELAHACAGLSYDERVIEFGVGFENFMPCAYTLLPILNCKRMQRIQIAAAGVESNFLISGVSFLLSSIFPEKAGLFFSIGLTNVMIGFTNIIFVNGIDGLNILMDLIGFDADKILSSAAKIVFKHSNVIKLFEKGMLGYAIFTLFVILLCMQIITYLFMIINILGVFLCF